jgi:ribosome-binding factor A
MRGAKLKRTDEILRSVISEALLTKVRDPRIGLVSITEVRTSPEYDTARVYVTVFGDDQTRENALAGLRSAASFLQAEIKKAVRMRRTPRLRFIYDDSIDRGFRVDAVLRGMSAEDDLDGDAAGTGEDDAVGGATGEDDAVGGAADEGHEE